MVAMHSRSGAVVPVVAYTEDTELKKLDGRSSIRDMMNRRETSNDSRSASRGQ